MTAPFDEDTARAWLAVAVEEARAGLAEGGIPIGAAGAVLAAALWLSFAADGIGLATAADLGNGVAAQTLVTTGWESARIAAVPSLVMVAAVVVAGLVHGVVPRWFTWVSAATLLPLAIALTPVGPSGLLGFFFGGAWLVATSVLLAAEAPPDDPEPGARRRRTIDPEVEGP